MVRNLLHCANFVLAGLAGLLLLILFFLSMRQALTIEEPVQVALPATVEPPQRAFVQQQEAYDAIGSGTLSVLIAPPALELPDLRPLLSYYGTNARPDSPKTSELLHFGLRGSERVGAIPAGEELYIRYDSSKTPGNYTFSPNNQPTDLWLVAVDDDKKAKVNIYLLDSEGNFVSEPQRRATLVLPIKDMSRAASQRNWRLGKFKVDRALLSRQRARWYGQDLFLNHHGGDEFAEFVGKERIEFGEKGQEYAIYLGPGDCAVWDGDRWQQAVLGEETRSLPLLCYGNVDDKKMNLELWDVEGRGRVAIQISRSREAWSPKTYARDFKFISSRTLSQFVFEVKSNREVLRSFDWLLQTADGWVPLESDEEIDGYVERRTPGVLFILEGPKRTGDGNQVLSGRLYSKSRSNAEEVQFELDRSPIVGTTPSESQLVSEEGEQLPPSPQQANDQNSLSDQQWLDKELEKQGRPSSSPNDSQAPPEVPAPLSSWWNSGRSESRPKTMRRH